MNTGIFEILYEFFFSINDIYFITCWFLYISLIYIFGFIQGFHEQRILVYFIYFELLQVLFIILLIISSNTFILLQPNYILLALLVLGVSGTETAVFLAIFICYYKLTGISIFKYNNLKKS